MGNLTVNDIQLGDKVTYISHNKMECGIVKAFSNYEYVFVVYNCDNDWEHYFNYTAARTRIKNLKMGW